MGTRAKVGCRLSRASSFHAEAFARVHVFFPLYVINIIDDCLDGDIDTKNEVVLCVEDVV